MNFLSSLVSRLFGKKDNDQSQTSQVTAPRSPIPVSSVPALSVQPVASQPQVSLAQAPDSSISPVSLVKAEHSPLSVVGASPVSPAEQPVPQPNLLQKAADEIGFAVQHPVTAAKNVGSAFVNAPMVQGFSNEIAAPFVQSTYQQANDQNRASQDAVDSQVLAAAKAQADPVKRAHLLSLLQPGSAPAPLDYNEIAGLNDTPEQVLGNAGGVALDSLVLPSMFAGNIAAGSLVKAAAKNAGIGSLYGADQAAHENVTDPAQFAENAGAGAAAGGVLSALGSGLGKLLGKLRPAPEASVVRPLPEPVENPAPIATLTPNDNPLAGTLINPHGDRTVEEALLDVPTFQRNQEAQAASQQAAQEAALLQKAQAKAAVPGTRTVTDLTGKKLTPQEVQDMHLGVAEPPVSQVAVRPISRDIAPTKVPISSGPEPSALRKASNIIPDAPSKGAMSVDEFSKKVLSGGDDKPMTVQFEHGYGGGTKVAEALDKNGLHVGPTTFSGSDPANPVIGNQYGKNVVTTTAKLRPSEVAVINESDPEQVRQLIRFGEDNGMSFIDNPHQVYEAYAKSLGKKAYINPVDGQTGRLFVVDGSVLADNAKPVAQARQDDVYKAAVEGSASGSNVLDNQKEFEKALNSGDKEQAMLLLSRMTPEEQKTVPQEVVDGLMTGGAAPSAAPKTAPEADVPAPKPETVPTSRPVPEEASSLKAPRQAQILLEKEANGPDKEAIRASLPEKERVSLDAMQDRGTARTDALGDTESVAKAYANQPALDGPEEYYAALEAGKRLSGLADPASVEARSNIYNAMLDYSNRAGLNLRSTQILFNDMPVELKVSTVLKQIMKSLERQYGPDSPEAMRLSDPAERLKAESRLTDLFDQDQKIQDRMSVSRGILSDPQAHSTEEITAAGDRLNAAKEELSQNAGDFAQYRDELVPSNIGAAEKLGNAQRVAMLSSVSGRARDLIQTPLTGAREVAASKLEGLIGRTLNKAQGTPGKFLDRGLGFSDLVKGVPSALRKFGQNISEGDTYSSIQDVLSNIKRTPDRTDLSGSTKGFFSRLTKAGTNLANDAVEGVRSGEVARQLRKVGQQAGLDGDSLDKFVLAGSYDPPAEVLAKGKQLQDVVNNVNDNPITEALRTINQGVAKIPVVGKTIKNALDPFPTWLGGSIWNAITDRNVVANTVNFVANLSKDPQYAVSQLSKALTGAGELYAAGYLLSKSGVLSETDANGDSYQGLYFHLGDRYVPVSSAGAVGTNIVLGHAAYQALNGADPVGGIVSGLADLYKSLNIDNVAGGNGYLTKAQGEFGDNPTQAAATVASGLGSQFIPAAFGDINSVLNQTPLNLTHEAADTTVEDPSSPSGNATDFMKTAEAQLQNKLPIGSQLLPRQEGKASQDFFDRVSQGNHTSGEQAQAAEDQKAQVASAYKDLQDQGVFTPKIRSVLDADTQKVYDTLEKGGTVSPADLKKLESGVTKNLSATADSRFLEDGDYDSNLTALKVKRAMLAADPTTTEKDLAQYDTQIKRGELYKEDAVPYSLVSQYGKTSLTEWRGLGDPKSDTYDPVAYQKLYDLDQAAAKAGASRNADDESKPLYSAKAASIKKGSGASTAKSNKIGTVAKLDSVSLQKLAGRSTGTAPLPNVAPIKASDLVKKRKISVSS